MTQAIQLCFSNTSQNYPVDISDKDAVAHFRKNNPHIIGNTIPKGTPYVVSHGNEATALEWRGKRPDLVCAFNQAQALSPQAQRNLADLSDLYGGDTLLAIANFYQDEIIPIVQNESVGAIGAATTAAETRLSEFGKAANKLQTAYEKVRSAYKGKVPAKQLKMLEQIARNCQTDFQLKFQAEIQKYIVRVKAGRRGTIYTNGQLGINRAKSGKTSRPIQISTTREFNNLRALERGSNLLGKGLCWNENQKRSQGLSSWSRLAA
ncbi:hypothetical protein HC752_02700 [Vibrio sp. S9_S30]|uniref:hypothetical protein n=1 Tax=Vibrio sp. S9_S30 TaxID=2720226 RepID=UPI00168093BC|nr:hypothetical protein [Vibrio sp. S9_S30]MBD1555847.1 hypothetical protein [Vibrio sp. S9_S30]